MVLKGIDMVADYGDSSMQLLWQRYFECSGQGKLSHYLSDLLVNNLYQI